MKPLRICACALTGLLLTGLAAGCASAGGQVQTGYGSSRWEAGHGGRPDGAGR